MALDRGRDTQDRTVQLVSRGFLFLGATGFIVGLGLLILFGTDSPGLGFVGVSALLLTVFAFLEPDTVRDILSQGRLQSGVKAVLSAVLIVAAVVLVNALVKVKLADKTIDLSKGQVNSLAPQTVQILQGLHQPLTATVWYDRSQSDVQTSIDLLHRYHDLNSNFRVDIRNINFEPQLAAQQNVIQSGSIVFQYQSRAPEVTTQGTEQAFDTSLVKIVTGRQPKAYFLTGDGEGSLTGSGVGFSYSSLKQVLDSQAIQSAPLNLLTGSAAQGQLAPGLETSPSPNAAPASGKVPEDADEVVILGPRSDLAPAEIQALQAYLDGGGHVLIAYSPFTKTNVNDLLTKYGVSFGAGAVLDDQLQFQRGNLGVLLIGDYQQSTVTRGMAGLRVVLPLVAPVTGAAKSGFTLAPLIVSKSGSCERTDTSIASATCQSDDKKGPFNLMATIEQSNPPKGAKPTRMVLIGNTAFATDQAVNAFQGSANVPLMVNAVNWLAGQDIVVNVPARDITPDTVILSNAQRQLVQFGYPIFIPLLVGAIGVSVYWRRRRTA
jgi:ABC-type uncharacterized transport system involved in gliding motility auxiliary subunit